MLRGEVLAPARLKFPSQNFSVAFVLNLRPKSGIDARICKHTPRQQDKEGKHEKASSTLRSSRAVPHPSTNRALRRLTSEFGRDPVHSTRYGRWREGKVTFKDARAPPWRIRCFWDPWQMGGSLLPGLALRRRRGPLPVRFAAWTQSVNSCGYSARTHDSCASGDRYEI